jgi:hypothetical protein
MAVALELRWKACAIARFAQTMRRSAAGPVSDLRPNVARRTDRGRCPALGYNILRQMKNRLE